MSTQLRAKPRTVDLPPTPGCVRILLVDDHHLLRDALAERLNRHPGFEVAGQAADGDEAVEVARDEQPDVVLLDIDMPGTFSFDAARRIRDELPRTHIVFLSAFSTDGFIEQALAVGARGYLTKTEPPDRMIEAIAEVMSGGVYFSRAVKERLIIDHDGVSLSGVTRSSLLTRRELEVLRYVARGWTKKQIAKSMAIAVKTVENHVRNLMEKLGLHDRVMLARFAIREGVVRA